MTTKKIPEPTKSRDLKPGETLTLGVLIDEPHQSPAAMKKAFNALSYHKKTSAFHGEEARKKITRKFVWLQHRGKTRQIRKMLQNGGMVIQVKGTPFPRGTMNKAIHVDPKLPAKAEAIRQHYLILDEAHQGAYASPKVSP